MEKKIDEYFKQGNKDVLLLDDPTDKLRLMELADLYVVLCRACNVEAEHNLKWTSQHYRKHIAWLEKILNDEIKEKPEVPK